MMVLQCAGAAARAATEASADRLAHEANSVLRHAFMACCELGEPMAIQGLAVWAASAFSTLRTLLPSDKAEQPTTEILPGRALSTRFLGLQSWCTFVLHHVLPSTSLDMRICKHILSAVVIPQGRPELWRWHPAH